MGEVFCDMGLLGSSKVHECSASDLIGQYVGHTGPLVKEKFEAALGQILFVDEAYRMTQGPFAKEATDEIVGLLTDERFRGKLIVILAGYDQDMNDLLASNRGLSSRFTEELHFSGLQPRDCLQVLQAALRKKRISLPAAAQADSATGQTLQDLFSQMMLLDSWGNARDVLTLAQRLISKAYTMPQDGSKSGKDYEIVLTHDIVSETAASMLLERQQREQGTQINPQALFNMAPTAPPDLLPPNKANVSTEERKVSKASTVLPTDHQEPTEPADVGEPRDPMVPDEVWASLQVSKKEAADQERQWLNDQAAFEREIQSAAAEQQDRRGQQEESQKQESITSDQQEIERLKWERERARLAELEAMQRREALEQEFRKAREEEAARRKEESIAKTKLRAMGLCPAGFRWFKQGSGWRCGGGSHFVTNEQLDHYSLD